MGAISGMIAIVNIFGAGPRFDPNSDQLKNSFFQAVAQQKPMRNLRVSFFI